MPARRLAALAVLPVSTAALVHVILFGSEHGPGGLHAAEFAGVLASAILLCALALFLSAALAPSGAGSTRHAPIATRGGLSYSATLWPALGACAAFACIEAIEGHFSLSGGLRAFALMLPASAATAWFAGFAAGATRSAAIRFAAFARARSRARALPPARRLLSRGSACRGRARRSAHSGRAPPLLA